MHLQSVICVCVHPHTSDLSNPWTLLRGWQDKLRKSPPGKHVDYQAGETKAPPHRSLSLDRRGEDVVKSYWYCSKHQSETCQFKDYVL